MARALIHAPASARRGDIVEIRALVAHPMETGQRVDAEGRRLPRDIIRRVECHYAGARVFAAELHAAIAANPYVAFNLVATRSGSIVVRWQGDRGFDQNASVELVVT